MSLLVSVMFVVSAVFVFGGAANAQQMRPPRGAAGEAAETQRGIAPPLKCEVTYGLDNAGTIVTGWQDLGMVSWPSRREKCRTLAKQNCGKARAKLTTYAPVGSLNMQAICNQGQLCVYFDARVGDKKYTKDGTCCATVKCTRPPCPWTGYQ